MHTKNKKIPEYNFEKIGKNRFCGCHVFAIPYFWRPLADSGYRPLGNPGRCKNGVRTGSISTSFPELRGVPQNRKNTKMRFTQNLVREHLLIFSYVAEHAYCSTREKLFKNLTNSFLRKLGSTIFHITQIGPQCCTPPRLNLRA